MGPPDRLEVQVAFAEGAGDGQIRSERSWTPRHVVGRDVERAAAASFLDVVSEGPAALLIEGEPGIGKTALWEEAVRAAEARAYRVLMARPRDSETSLSFAALSDLLSPVADDVLGTLPPPQRRAVEVALLRMDPGEAPLDHRAIATGFHSLLSSLAASATVVVAIDDLPWMDPASARVLEFALRRLRDLRVGILATGRLPLRSVVFDSLQGTLPPDQLRRLRPGPLSLAAVHDLLRTRLGARFPRRLLLRIGETSKGNPLFVLEIARALLDSGADPQPGAPLPVPETLSGLLARRIEVLPPATCQGLLAAATLSDPTLAAVSAATGSAAAEALVHAEDAKVVEIEKGRVRFAHPLLASEVYASATPSARRTLHQKLAEIATDIEEHARHLALASRGPDGTVAAVLDAAAVRASARGGPDATADLYEQALRLTPPEDEVGIRRRTLARASGLFRSGDHEDARRLLEGAIDSFPSGPERAETLRLLALIRAHSDNMAAAAQLLEQALAEAVEDRSLLVTIHMALAWVVIWMGDVPRGAEQARAALQLTDEDSDPGTAAQAMAMAACGDLLLGRGVPEALLERALSLERSAGDLPVEWRPSFLGAYVLKLTDQLNPARAAFAEVRRGLEERGDEASLPFFLFQLGELECWAGDYEAAGRCADEALEVAVWTGQHLMRAAALYVRGLSDAHLGLLDAAQAAAEEGLAEGFRTGVAPLIHLCSTVLGFVALSRDDPPAVHERLGPISELLLAVGLGEPALFRFIPDEIEALVAMGDLEQAHALLRPYEKQGQALERPSVLAATARCRGLVLGAEGDLAGAAARLEEAVSLHARLPMPFDLGRTLLVKGRVHRRRKEKLLAKQHLEEALAIFEQLGTPAWAAKARSELGRVGLRPRAPAGLSATERRVAELASRGMTNRRIADAAFMSVKTVESALSRVYRKLGIHSRAELGAQMAERRGSRPRS